MAAPSEIEKLVERFDRNREQYLSPGYNETELRQEFLNPFFAALGWDIENRQGYAEPYKDVIHEDAIKVGSATKAPDYSFRIGGTRKFFVEAKRPSVHIKEDAAPAFQLRRYAWSAKLPLSLLTDFEEFAVYDCRIKPTKHDSATVGRLKYLTFADYIPHWDDIASVFSREAVLTGSFDKYAESAKGKKGTTEVDDAFLKEIESWRDQLARNIAIRNPKLTQRELNFAVQKTIDRIIFLRICEDRGIETYGSLQALVNGERTYKRLCEQFYRADEKYNSGLFHFQEEKDRGEAPDSLTLDLHIDDKPLIEIIGNLYYPDCPYEFSVLPADILGQVYEQFLGKVIRLTAGHQAKVEDKPEVKKAGGVYYTPTYIVEYIVKNTVGKLVEGKTPKQIANIHVLDPACGSGSFLIGAYQYLLDWHRDWYVKDGTDKWAKGKNQALYQGQGGDWRLTTAERKRILLNNIYGVDIDSQAVEVTKLSLLLKVLEGENEQSITQQLKMFHERALPDLGSNIKCGNSLIGPDFYEGRQLAFLDDNERNRINVFEWKAEFKEIMDAGGFDAVIGNPPYIRVRVFKELYPGQAEYMESSYECATNVWDVYLLFYERAIRTTKMGGSVSFIVPIQTLHQPNCESLRRYLLRNTHIRELADLSSVKVFEGAVVKNCILTTDRGTVTDEMIEIRTPASSSDLTTGRTWQWPQSKVGSNPGASLKVELLSPMREICDRLRDQSWLLEELCYSTFGMRSCAKGKGQGGKERLVTFDSKAKFAKPYLEGRDIVRFGMRPTGRYIRYIPSEMYSSRSPELFETHKIVSQSMLSKARPVATFDESGFYVEQSLVCIIPHGILTDQKPKANISLKFILGILNSRLESFYFESYVIDQSLGGGLIHATPGTHDKLIVPRGSGETADRLISLVDSMLSLQVRIIAAKTDQERTAIQRQIDATDKQIDALVYELYGLTEDEIRIVESPQSLPKQ
jgi:TaqI-like C-terminal specificity domain/Eco57I restriction-modification methylase/N-6 DNA Methylase